ncbi:MULTISPECIES: hypothetical protein [unclassified Fusibacter]|uniref:hypothetical protein n=1 Tax=unclassified Fusibacter TaxID=2624464 RepID=UPI0010128448|nr:MULTISPECIES: hypothetical protein [unclassified Fusibacter]MCK8059574.1 hypothetical protein [Fusibacter sp. A2]NPE21375.1 hypothetical protein [Fusibacter sp. A1]RXV61791.1 hypothetical protein DWB64_06020 [Fusibacter sp. A1]
MKELVKAEVMNGAESMFRALSLLRRKSFDVISVEMVKRNASDISDLKMTVEKRETSNPHSAKLLVEKLIGFENVCSENA